VSNKIDKKLLSGLKDKDMGSRMRALKSLISTHPDHKQVIDFVVKVVLRKADIKSDFEEQFFFLACLALKNLGIIQIGKRGNTEQLLHQSLKQKKREGFLQKLGKSKANDDPGIKMIVIETLAEIGTKESMGPLKELLLKCRILS